MSILGAAYSTPASTSQRANLPSSFRHSTYASAVDWTKSCLLIDGKPVVIISAEFHYFRVPDRERWRPILIDIKGMGFNTIRIYIHWGYHCSAEGVYNFRGNRDIDYLLQLCTELQLFVITAPGPYICAEVQAGGFPIWLVAQRDIRIRHLTNPPIGFSKKWDQRFHDHSLQYFEKVLPILIKHERTTNPQGCIIAMQIENELRERNIIGIGGLDEEIRLLSEAARKIGSTVPFFHNDDSPIGSWSKGAKYRSLKVLGARKGIPAYRTDLYGFDLYFTFPPGDKSGDPTSMQVGMLELCGISSCANTCGLGGTGVGGSDTKCLSNIYDHSLKHTPPPPLGWAGASQMESAVDTLGSRLEKFGGSSANGPSVVAEAQVGWINQWGRLRSYDDVYNFFGNRFSSALQSSLLSQGVSIVNHYMAYGGTNHGTVGDAEVYSSYDYSAFIREYGLLSGRGRELRHVMLFARTFADVGFANTVPLSSRSSQGTQALAAIKSTVPSALIAVRQAVTDAVSTSSPSRSGSKPPTYAFLRNLKADMLRFNMIVNNIVLPCRLAKCESAVVPLYHNLKCTNLSILACTVPVICRTNYNGSELWVLRIRPSEVGRFVLYVGNDRSTGRQAICANWALLSSSKPCSGEIVATDQDPGAATSILAAPLEELPLNDQNNFAQSDSPVGLRVSTEEPGLCFSFTFSAKSSAVVSIIDRSEGGSSIPCIRLLCLTKPDARTFTADLKANDTFLPSERGSSVFSAAWGVKNISFLPSGRLHAGFSQDDEKSSLFVIRENAFETPEQFQKTNKAISAVMPGSFEFQVPQSSLLTTLSQGVDCGNPLHRNFEIPVEEWTRRVVDWDEDVTWKRISYENRDPLDHHMTSGHVAYRLRFRSSSQRGALILNVRHSAVVWCNGMAVGTQVCFSHNVMSAGAMHAVDLHQAGKKRHDLSKALQKNTRGIHEIIILVLSLGQSRSPFLLNDVRNKRGLLSARLSHSTKASSMNWDICGVDMTCSDDAYGSSGLPLEDDANTLSYDTDFKPVRSLEVKADDGLVYYRGHFKVPPNSVEGGCTRYPLRIKVTSGAHVRVMIWVNTLFLGRYVEPLGPQSNFYIPEGLIKQCKGNSLVIAVYGSVDTCVSAQLLPWVVNPDSGNLDEEKGQVYALRIASFELVPAKKI